MRRLKNISGEFSIIFTAVRHDVVCSFTIAIAIHFDTQLGAEVEIFIKYSKDSTFLNSNTQKVVRLQNTGKQGLRFKRI